MVSFFIDANVVIDFLDSQRSGHQEAVSAFSRIAEQGIKPVISEDLLTTIYYVVKDKVKVLEFFAFILSRWQIVCFGSDLLKKTVTDCQREPALDFEDRVQGHAALRAGCGYLLTGDGSFCSPPGLVCLSLQDVIQMEEGKI